MFCTEGEEAGEVERLFVRLIYTDLPVTERSMNRTDSKTQNKFSDTISHSWRFTSPHCGNTLVKVPWAENDRKSLDWLIPRRINWLTPRRNVLAHGTEKEDRFRCA